MGAWIEIRAASDISDDDIVAPFMGAWIEIRWNPNGRTDVRIVAPFMGAWIEIEPKNSGYFSDSCRTLYGCVD